MSMAYLVSRLVHKGHHGEPADRRVTAPRPVHMRLGAGERSLRSAECWYVAFAMTSAGRDV